MLGIKYCDTATETMFVLKLAMIWIWWTVTLGCSSLELRAFCLVVGGGEV